MCVRGFSIGGRPVLGFMSPTVASTESLRYLLTGVDFGEYSKSHKEARHQGDEMTATEIVQSFTNDTLTAVHFANIGRSVRNEDGNLRSLTDSEREFIAATRAEAKARGLL